MISLALLVGKNIFLKGHLKAKEDMGHLEACSKLAMKLL